MYCFDPEMLDPSYWDGKVALVGASLPGLMDLRNAVKQSCDTYFYEVARLLGVDRLKKTAEDFGLGKKVLENSFLEEKKGIVPSTEWKKDVIGKNWVLSMRNYAA